MTTDQSVAHSDGLDRLLIERIARRDRTALRQLFERHYRCISGFFSGLALDKEVSDELTVDTFLTAWNSAATFDDNSPVSFWLLALGYRCVLRSIAAPRDQPDPGAGELVDEGSQVRFDELSRADWIRALGYLSMVQRAALALTYHLGHSCAEVAAIMGGSETSTQRHVFFATRKLYALAVLARHRNEPGETAADLPAAGGALGNTGLAEMETIPVGQDET
jgi:RNA polymerase sigma-70 factor (ECF subfamily)